MNDDLREAIAYLEQRYPSREEVESISLRQIPQILQGLDSRPPTGGVLQLTGSTAVFAPLDVAVPTVEQYAYFDHPFRVVKESDGDAFTAPTVKVFGGSWIRNGEVVTLDDTVVSAPRTTAGWVRRGYIRLTRLHTLTFPSTTLSVEFFDTASTANPECIDLAFVVVEDNVITELTQLYTGGQIKEWIQIPDTEAEILEDHPWVNVHTGASLGVNTDGNLEIYNFKAESQPGDFMLVKRTSGISSTPPFSEFNYVKYKSWPELVEDEDVGPEILKTIGVVAYDYLYDYLYPGTPNHNFLFGLQGGDELAGEFYHLTEGMYDFVSDIYGGIYNIDKNPFWVKGGNADYNWGKYIGNAAPSYPLRNNNIVIDLENMELLSPHTKTIRRYAWDAGKVYDVQSDGILSIDVENRQLCSDVGSTVTVDWQYGHLRTSPVSKLTLDWFSCLLYDPTSDDLKVAWADSLLYDEETRVSLDWKNRTLSKQLEGSVVLNWDSLQLIGNGMSSVHWGERLLYDTSEKPVVAWNDCFLYDKSGVRSATWTHRLLKDVDDVVSVDWDERALRNEDEVKTVDWQGRSLLYGDPPVTALNWANGPHAAIPDAESGDDLDDVKEKLNAVLAALRQYGIVSNT